jgi:NTE family protein
LGAFGCGAWLAVAPWLREHRHELVGIAGASIGALNGAVVACHARSADLGAAELERLWRVRIAAPSSLALAPRWPGPIGDELRAWSGWWSGLALGNPALFTPIYAHWHPLAALQRAVLPLYSQRRMQRLLGDIVGTGYASPDEAMPLFAVAATDVLSGGLCVFMSDDRPIDTAVLSASAAIPLMFEPIAIDGRLYCDGEVNRHSPISAFIHALRASGRVDPQEPLQLITIGQFSRMADHRPRTSHELLDRSLHLLLADKLAAEPIGPGHRIDIKRGPEPHEGISGQFDYSAERIGALIASGRSAADVCLRQPRVGASQPARIHPLERVS